MMTDKDLAKARAWAEETDQPYPIKSGFLALLDEIDRQRAIVERVRAFCNERIEVRRYDTVQVVVEPSAVLAAMEGDERPDSARLVYHAAAIEGA